MTPADIEIGTRLELLPISAQQDGEGQPLISCLEAVEHDGGLVVLAPISEGRVVPFHPGDALAVVFERKGERFGLRAVVRDRFLEGELRFLYLWPETDSETVQRRDFYRLAHIMDCQWRAAPDPERPSTEMAPWTQTLTRNIGGGGIGLLFESKPTLGMNIEGRLEAEGEIRFLGRVVRIEPLPADAMYRYEAGVVFTGIPNRDRERLIHLIYEIQRNLLSKGWSGA